MTLYSLTVRALMKEMAADLANTTDATFARQEAMWFGNKYPKVKVDTATAHLTRLSTNARSQTIQPNQAPSESILLFKALLIWNTNTAKWLHSLLFHPSDELLWEPVHKPNKRTNLTIRIERLFEQKTESMRRQFGIKCTKGCLGNRYHLKKNNMFNENKCPC